MLCTAVTWTWEKAEGNSGFSVGKRPFCPCSTLSPFVLGSLNPLPSLWVASSLPRVYPYLSIPLLFTWMCQNFVQSPVCQGRNMHLSLWDGSSSLAILQGEFAFDSPVLFEQCWIASTELLRLLFYFRWTFLIRVEVSELLKVTIFQDKFI